LAKELGLSAEQQTRLEAIQRETREKIAGISVENPADRKKEIGRLRGQSRAQIAAMLNDEQKTRYAEIVAAQQGGATTRGRVWVVDNAGTPKAVDVRLGISDGSYTELLGGTLKAGDEVIIGSGGPSGSRTPAKGALPRFGI
jgi:HlyD family secretion protein